METSNFFDTGQRNEFPVPEEFFNLSPPDSDEFIVDIKRQVQFFCQGQQITLGKLREFFTDKAIELYEHDGYIVIKRSDDIKKTSQEWLDEVPKEHNLIIMDPDGWDRTNYVYSFHEELITEEEFMMRVSSSTIQAKTSFIYYKK